MSVCQEQVPSVSIKSISSPLSATLSKTQYPRQASSSSSFYPTPQGTVSRAGLLLSCAILSKAWYQKQVFTPTRHVDHCSNKKKLVDNNL